MDGAELFTKVRRPLVLASDQTPEYTDIRKAGHEGGDFLFVRKQPFRSFSYSCPHRCRWRANPGLGSAVGLRCL